nr:annexin [Variovorax boronicumulans]
MGRAVPPAHLARARPRADAADPARRARPAAREAVAEPVTASAETASAWPRYLAPEATAGPPASGADALLDARMDMRREGRMDARLDARFDARLDTPGDARLDARLDAGLDARLLPLHGADTAARAPLRPAEPLTRPTPPDASLSRPAGRPTPAAPAAAPPSTAPAAATTAPDAATPAPPANPGTPDAAAAPGAPGDAAAPRVGAARPAGPAGAAGPVRAEGRGAAQEEDGKSDAEGPALPDRIDAQADAALQAPPLPWQALDAPWEAPADVPADALLAASTPQRAPAPAAAPREGPAAAPPGANAEDQRRAAREAASQARQAYAGAADQLRGMHQQLLERANGITHYMAQAHGLQAGQIVQRHDLDHGAIDQAADAAAAATEEAGQMAIMAVDSAALDASQAIAAAGRSAHGLIDAGERSGAARIASVVGGLVSGHVSAYNGAVRQAETAYQAARRTLTQWSEARATHFSTQRGAWLDRAKNEKRQLRIPRWVEPEVQGLQQRFDAKKQAWEQSRDTTACSLSCSYQAALTGENARLATQGRSSVAAALRQARSQLRSQQQAAQQALAGLTRSQLQQLRTQQRAAQSRLNSQARGALSGVRREAQQAVGGLQAATRGALPTYLRAAQGLEQNLRASAARGAGALRQAAERAPEGALQGARASGSRLDQRLQANQQRLDGSLAEQAGAQLQRSAQETGGLQAALAQLQAQGAEQRAQSAAGFTEAFGGLAGTVAQAAQSWTQPLTVRMAGFIAQQRAQAASALASLRSDAPAATPAPPPPAADSGGPAAAPAPDCGHCASGGGGGGGGAAGGTAPGLDRQVRDEVEYNAARNEPATYFASQLEAAGAEAQTALDGRANRVVGALGGGFAGTVDEAGVLAALRGMTLAQGRALDTQVYPRRHRGRHLDTDLRRELGADSTDYEAASAYLYGDNVTGARLELADSVGVFNDDEARIEEVMRALSPEQLAALGRDAGGTMAEVRDALGGTDRAVFDALARGEHATADALRLRDAVDEARVDGNADAVHSAIERYTGAPPEGDWRAAQEIDGDARRQAVVQALGGLVSEAAVARGVAPGTDVAGLSAEDRAVAYVSRDIDVYVGGAGPEGEPHMVTRRLEGANRDLAGALLRHGESSVEARAARLGVEMQRTGDPPNAVNIDRATFDPRFNANLANASPAEREAHRRAAEERARVVMLAAERYASGPATPEDDAPAHDPANPAAAMDDTRVTAARDRVIGQLQSRFGSDSTGAALAAGLLTDARPSPETAALAMQHAMAGCGTNEELLFRFTERMDRDEIAAMRAAYRRNTGNALDADLGTFGEGFLGEVSGDDRLRMERALLGQPRNDRERLEVAAFAIEQQRREASGFGAWLADGTLADEAMGETEAELRTLAGGSIEFGPRGVVRMDAASRNFDAQGRYTGTDRDSFASTAATAQAIAETYGRRIDAFADIATTGIAILGAIAAAVITVATGGAAGPLIAAAIVTGLASMSANYAIKGGRYGWEQAAVDLGMTAVQAVTAGVGAQLGAAAQIASKGAQAASTASRTLVTLSRIFTGNPVVDQIIVGAITGSIGGMANAAFDERTWAHGADDAIGALFGGLIKGGLSGAATATLTNSIEALGRNGAVIAERARAYAAQGGVARGLVGLAGRGIGGVGRGIDAALNLSAQGGMARGAGAMAARGLTRGSISAIGGMGGRATEILVDAGTGRFKGDAGDALLDIGQAGAHAFVQGIGEGAGEAVGQARHARGAQRLEAEIAAGRAERGLPPLAPDALQAAAQDLSFMHQVGEGGPLGRAIHLDHVVTHGGLEPVAAPVRPAAPDAPAPAVHPPAAPEASAAPAAEAGGGVPPGRGMGGGAGDGGPTPGPHPAPAAPDGDGNRLLPGLRSAEVDAAIDAAQAGPALRIGAGQPGADVRPPPADHATLAQRQRAGALHEQADGLMQHANALLDTAIAREAAAALADSHNPRRAAALRAEADRLLDQAVGLEARATGLRAEAAEFASGRRSATADLPGPGDVDALFAGMVSEQPGLVRVPLSDVERDPALLQRLVRPLLEGEGGGRMVLRVESERSRSLVHVDADGNVTIEGGASAHLNFGSFERAVEFVMQNSEGRARIIAFEVDEGWVRALRSAAIPEHGTADLHGQPRLVDVRFADDQMEIPAGLIGELGRAIVPGSGRVHELGAPGGGYPPADGGAGPATPPPGTGPRPAPGHTDESGHSTTAAAIPGSEFQGGTGFVVRRGGTGLAEAETGAALQRLIGPDGQFHGTVRPTRNDPGVLLVPQHDGGELQVRVRVGPVEANADGLRPVATYRRNGDRVEITVSEHASAAQIQRALAHELNELRFARHQRNDALRPGVRPNPPPDANAQLSRHDRGRVGEIEHLARAIETARGQGDTRALALLQDEAGRLVAHLGLVHGGEAADARRALALSALEPTSAGRRLLGEMVEAARTNPMLEPLTGSLDDVFVLARQAAHQQTLGRGDQRQLALAARRVVEEGLVRNGGRTVDHDAIARARDQLPDPAARALLDRAIDEARAKGSAIEREIVRDLRAAPDPLARELAAQRFGDHVNYQDFALFQARYLAAHTSLDRADPALQQRLFTLWAGGAFVTAGGGVRGISIGAVRAVATDWPTAGLSLRDNPTQEAHARQQVDAMRARDDILAELGGRPPPSGRTPEQLATELSAAMLTIRDSGEALGEAAASRFATDTLGLGQPLPCSRTGAGVPDLAFHGPDGRLVVVEAKGPQADLGFRRTADGRRAEQGTPEYLESLARDMMRPTCPADVQALGARILAAVRADPPQVDYYVVRQPLDASGRPTPLEAQKFDLTTGRTTTMTATAP